MAFKTAHYCFFLHEKAQMTNLRFICVFACQNEEISEVILYDKTLPRKH